VSLTVDLVVTGDTKAVLDAAVLAVRRGQRVLVVLSTDTRTAQRFRRDVRRAAKTRDCQLMVMANAEIVCVEAIDCVEAVVIRYARTGRLSAVNASAFVSCGSTGFSHDLDRYNSGIRALRTYRRTP
jgi:hypothetical protein